MATLKYHSNIGVLWGAVIARPITGQYSIVHVAASMATRHPILNRLLRFNFMETPTLTTMAKTFATESVKHAASGFKNRPPEEIERIGAICMSCEHIFHDEVGMRCRKCGCIMSIKIKWATTRCPVGKW